MKNHCILETVDLDCIISTSGKSGELPTFLESQKNYFQIITKSFQNVLNLDHYVFHILISTSMIEFKSQGKTSAPLSFQQVVAAMWSL